MKIDNKIVVLGLAGLGVLGYLYYKKKKDSELVKEEIYDDGLDTPINESETPIENNISTEVESENNIPTQIGSENKNRTIDLGNGRSRTIASRKGEFTDIDLSGAKLTYPNGEVKVYAKPKNGKPLYKDLDLSGVTITFPDGTKKSFAMKKPLPNNFVNMEENSFEKLDVNLDVD